MHKLDLQQNQYIFCRVIDYLRLNHNNNASQECEDYAIDSQQQHSKTIVHLVIEA